MIESFFRSLEEQRVAYLLISGQATVLYGAAVFSEDIDLWIRPTAENADALLAALRSVGATYYKLTPPLEPGFLLRGHGFHFRVPDEPEFFLDIMGQPPRVPAFDDVAPAASVMQTAWGDIPTIDIKHLAALKTTQRLGDYPVIGRLALRHMEETITPRPQDFRWALDNLHTIDELEEFLRTYPAAEAECEGELMKKLASEVRAEGVGHADTVEAVERWLGERMLAHRQADRRYWQGIIEELRELRAAGELMPVGRPV